ncbi:alpha/beta hydrolase fold [Amycolatopsis xylanica]|uniref:Alpha/beta hydrolase fold n=1 Tax=Amycolatopsis xylanica TaxID=589385 RepID=A0A1H3MU06_9PSEU|nr:alpha/beta hydrolase [Amycolatopsis xylanica]SDY80177.1 alpha/beta hydrolase fold [Amycolatopsis xylanica]
MRKRLMALGICALTFSSVLGATTANAAPALNWQPCQGLPLECATLTVPLDYRNPGGAKLDVAVSRLKSTNPKARRGVLLLNPGGPGGPGLDLPLAIAQLAPTSLTDAYDLIGFDPRGTGKSSPVSCALTPAQLSDATKVIPYPAPDGDISGNVAYAKQVAKQCHEKSGAVLPFITSQNTARDMDGIRAALGEKKISYLGYSYGSYLGAVYTTLFPAQSDRIVLDSVVDPRDVWRTVWQHWGPSNEERFEDFAKWAAVRDPSYGLGATPAAVRATYLDLTAKLDKAPLGWFDGNTARALVRGALYDDRGFATMAKQLQALKGGVAPPQPGDPGDEGQSSLATLWGVACGDAAWPGAVPRYQRDVLADKQRYPITAGMPSNVWPCTFWPAKPIEPALRIGDRGPSNVLLTQNLRDPATPLVGAKAMRAALGDRARLVTADAGGHGAYLFQENACLTNATTTFLVNGTFPVRDIRCGTQLTKSAADPAREKVVRDIQNKQFPL